MVASPLRHTALTVNETTKSHWQPQLRIKANKKALPSHDREWTRQRYRATIKPDGGAQFPIAAASVLFTGAVSLAPAVYRPVKSLSNLLFRRNHPHSA